jgi:hypothetical protein
MPDSADDVRRRLRARMLRTVLLLDAGLYLDAALRWELGLGFVRAPWLVAALAMAVTFWLFDRFMVGFLVVDVVQGVLTFPLWCWAFIIAGTGNPYIDWRTLPVVDFFKISLLDNWLRDGGFLMAGIAAVAHGVLAPRWRDSTPRGHVRSEASWLRGLGLALIVASSVALIPPVELAASLYVGKTDPRDLLGTKRLPLEATRKAIWLVVCGAGVWQLRRSRRSSQNCSAETG